MGSPPDAAASVPVGGRIAITGGSGFVGGAIRRELSERPLRLLVRDRAASSALSSDGIELVEGDVTEPESLRGAFDGCAAVVHLVAIIEESGQATFDGVIHRGTANVISEVERTGVPRLLHMSAMGTRNDPRYGYFEAKWQAEQAVKASKLAWTIFRPSIVFGPGDGFINVLARLVKASPVIPVVGDGASTFQPIAVEEVAASFARALEDPAAVGQTYELGGGKIYTYEQLLDLIAAKLGKSKPKVHVPVGLMMPIVKITKPLPSFLRPPVTEEQLKMLAIDNSSDASATEVLIGRSPLKLEDGLDYILSKSKSKSKSKLAGD